MKIYKDMALIGMGMAITLLYQKYNEPVMDMMEDVVNTTSKKINKKLEDMS